MRCQNPALGMLWQGCLHSAGSVLGTGKPGLLLRTYTLFALPAELSASYVLLHHNPLGAARVLIPSAGLKDSQGATSPGKVAEEVVVGLFHSMSSPGRA